MKYSLLLASLFVSLVATSQLSGRTFSVGMKNVDGKRNWSYNKKTYFQFNSDSTFTYERQNEKPLVGKYFVKDSGILITSAFGFSMYMIQLDANVFRGSIGDQDWYLISIDYIPDTTVITDFYLPATYRHFNFSFSYREGKRKFDPSYYNFIDLRSDATFYYRDRSREETGILKKVGDRFHFVFKNGGSMPFDFLDKYLVRLIVKGAPEYFWCPTEKLGTFDF